MRPSFFLVLVLVLLPLSAAASRPSSSVEYIEVSRPLPFDSLTPSCTFPVLSSSFGDTAGLPPAIAAYSAPSGGCDWSRAVLHVSASCNGSQHGRIAAVWLSESELLRTSTPRSAPDGTFWNVRKDVSRYAALLRRSNVTVAVMLENVVDGVNDGVYEVNVTFMYYSATRNAPADGTVSFPLSLIPPRAQKLGSDSETFSSKDSLNLNENPADLIVPISASGEEGFWFKIQSKSDSIKQAIHIPSNTYRAVIEVYVSFHGDDEFWYSNPPNSYIETNNLHTKRGNGAYREILVAIDGAAAGSVIPFPVIFSGGINPLFWKPLVSIGAFDLPSYELELTPFLGMLLDGKQHWFEFGVSDSISYWLIGVNLHLWLDGRVDKVLAGAIRFRNPASRVRRSARFRQLDGRATIQGSRRGEFSGWVNYSAGNVTTTVEQSFTFDNVVTFKMNGTVKEVRQNVELRTKVKASANRKRFPGTEVEKKFHLQMMTSGALSSAKGAEMSTVKLLNRMQERKESGRARSNLDNAQECSGFVVGKDEDVLSGTATTYHKYDEKDLSGCYKRRAFAEGGSMKNDTTPPCARAASL